MWEPTFRRSLSLYETVRTIYFHHFSWSHKYILCKDTTTFELSLIYSTIYMVFPRQPLLFTETVPHYAYEHTKLWRGTIRSDKIISFESLSWLKYSLGNSGHIDIIACGNRFSNDKFKQRKILYVDTLCRTQNITFRKIKWIMTSLMSPWWQQYM